MMQKMLHLSPNDNQGVHYELLDHLIECRRDGEADGLMKRYKADRWAGRKKLFGPQVKVQLNGKKSGTTP